MSYYSIQFTLFVYLFAFSLQAYISPEQKAYEIVKSMNLSEKISYLHGSNSQYSGSINAIPRLGLPIINLNDGPQGVGNGKTNVTDFPSTLTVSASWDRDLMYQYAKAIGKEQWGKGVSVSLGPMVNIARVPQWGRNFEGMGEDPFLASELVKEYIEGIQSSGVIGCIKHYINNEQEIDRTTVSSNLDDRTFHEIYYPPFKAAVDANVGSAMCSYNKINDTYACENDKTLNKELKGRMKFKGWVMSDWGATHSTEKAFKSGLDQEMPDDTYFGKELENLILNGTILESEVDNKVLRIMTQLVKFGIIERPPNGTIYDNVRSEEHTLLAEKLAAESMVLLKNDDNLLPFSNKTLNIAVIGDIAHDVKLVSGGGSGFVDDGFEVYPLDGIKQRALAFTNSNVTYVNSSDTYHAMEVAFNSDVVVFVSGAETSEGDDRKNLKLWKNDTNLLYKISKVNKNIVAVIHNPAHIDVSWQTEVKAVIAAFYPGEQAGKALADILFGDVNPSGKLPITLQLNENIPLNSTTQWPGIDDEVSYNEKLLVGYRFNNALNIPSAFPFGYGLSYTSFSYSNLKVVKWSDIIQIQVTVTNTGKVQGKNIVQLYITFPDSANEPPNQLKGFKKVDLKPGQSTTVDFQLKLQSLSIFDITIDNWKIIDGTYGFQVGSSSSNFHANSKLYIKGDDYRKIKLSPN